MDSVPTEYDNHDNNPRLAPFGQLGRWTPSSGVQDVFTSTAYVFTEPLPSVRSRDDCI
jgi:hypothetical protein